MGYKQMIADLKQNVKDTADKKTGWVLLGGIIGVFCVTAISNAFQGYPNLITGCNVVAEPETEATE